MYIPTILVFLYMHYLSLIVQLEVIIIEIPTLQARRLRTNPRLHRAKHLLSMNLTYGDTGFFNGQTNHLSMKVRNCILENQIFC